jgi:hypothetical protein
MHVTSPPAGVIRPYTATEKNSNIPSQSVPGSRLQSDDEEEDDEDIVLYDPTIHRRAAK